MRGPLSGIRILDLTQAISGPYGTKLLAGYGAEVIKVERLGGDPARRFQPICSGADGESHSALFSFLNTNKASVSLNLKDPSARDALLRVAVRCDAVIESFRPGTMERLGLPYEALRDVRQDIVLTSISNFGQKGAFRDFEATELNIFAFGGRMAASGTRPRPPVRLLGGTSLFMAGTVAAGATLIALRGAKRDGNGDHLDISIANVVLGEPDRGLCLYSYSGINMERLDGPRPYQVFPASDGFVVIAVNRGIERVAEMIGRPELTNDQRFSSNVSRQEHADELEPIIIAWTVARTKSEILAEANIHRVVAAPVATMPEVLRNSHLERRRYFRSVPGARCNCEEVQPGPPFRIHTTANSGWSLDRPAPLLGGDTQRVLKEIGGLSDLDIERLVRRGAAATSIRSEVGNRRRDG